MASEIKVDTISEKTSANGITIDGVNIKDSAIATAGSVPLTAIDIDGGTDIGAAIVDADLFIIDDGAGGTNRKTTASRLKTYIGGSDPSSADGDSLGTASAEWSDLYLADGGIIYFGNDQDVTLTHDPDDGLFLKSIATADNNPVLLTLQTGETDIAQDDVIGAINFQAPDEGTGTDAILVAAGIEAVSEGDFSSSNNATKLSFKTGASEAASEKMSLSSAGLLTIADDLVIKDAGTIGSASDTDAIAIASDGDVTFSQKVGIGADHDLGTGLHIKTGDSGLSSPNTQCDDLVIESDGHTGITIAAPAANQAKINFADNADDNVGSIAYNHSDNTLTFRVDDSDKIRIDEGNTYSKTMIEISTSGNFIGGDGVGESVLSIAADVGDGQQGIGIRNNNTHSSGGGHKLIQFQNGSGADAGEISHTGSTTVSYSTSSDYRLKENESLISDGITRIKKLKPYRFNWKVEPDRVVDGFFAHEVQGIVDEAISGTKDETHTKTNCVLSSDGTLFASGVSEEKWTQGKIDGAYASNSTWIASKVLPKHQSIDQSKLVPLLTSALQEAITKIETLETKVTALEG